MKIALIDPIGSHGGMEYYDFGLLLGLIKADCKPYFFTSYLSSKIPDISIVTHTFFKNMWNQNLFLKILFFIFAHAKIFFFCKRNNINILHYQLFHLGIQNLFILFFAKIVFRKKVVVTLHDVNSLLGRKSFFFEEKSFDYIDGIIVHNSYSRDSLLKKNRFQNISIIPHGNYLNFVKPLKYSTAEGNNFNLLFFGQIKKVKGLKILLLALKEVKKYVPKINLTIAGKVADDNPNRYLNFISKNNLESNVDIHFKYILNEHVSDFFRNADLVVLPYNEIYQSGVLLLTMSYGRAVLCSDLPPFKDVIKHNKSGFLFKKGNYHDLAKKIIQIHKNNNMIHKVVKNANELLRTKFDWNSIGRSTKAFYEKV